MPESWAESLRDKDFALILEQARKRNFESLPLPTVESVFSDILKYLEGIRL